MIPALHPLNGGFAWRTPQAPFRLLTTEQARAFDERGYTVVRGAFSRDEMRTVEAEIDPWEEKVERVLREQLGGRAFIARAGEITFTTHLVARSPRLRAFCAGPFFQDLAHDLIGADARLYWDQAVYKKPGTEAPFPWHQDNGYTFVEPQQYLTCWVALVDADATNGSPQVAPGWHRRGTLAHRETALGWCCFDSPPRDAELLELQAGDVAVFSSLTPHTTGANRSSGVRKAYIVQLAPDGAELVLPEPNGTLRRQRADAPERQFPVLVGGCSPGT